MSRDYFSMVPYKTFLKILNRLEEEGTLSAVSKGVYQINSEQNIDQDSAVLKEYSGDTRGIIVGHSMYRQYGISDYDDGFVDIYTRMIPDGTHKNIGKYRLTGANLYYSRQYRTLITTLELIENAASIHDIDYLRYDEARKIGLKDYDIASFKNIIEHIHYQYSTIVTLEMLLKDAGITDSLCVDIYQSIDSGK